MSQNRGSHTKACGPDLADFLFVCGLGAKNGLACLNDWEKNQKKYIS